MFFSILKFQSGFIGLPFHFAIFAFDINKIYNMKYELLLFV